MSKVKTLPGKSNTKKETPAPEVKETIQDAQEVINNAAPSGETKPEETKVENAAPEKPKKPEIVIVSATYGIPGIKEVDFTATCKLNQKLTNKMVTTDPVPKKVKSATIVITVDGEKRTATFTENEKILFEEFKPEVKEEIVTQE